MNRAWTVTDQGEAPSDRAGGHWNSRAACAHLGRGSDGFAGRRGMERSHSDRIPWILVAVAVAMLSGHGTTASAAPATDPVIEQRAQALEKLLTAPCCYKGTLVDHASAVATQMREEIRAMLRGGKSRSEILAHYKAKYGQAVLVEPPKGGLSGFMLYGIPFGLAVLGLVVMTAFMVRRRRTGVGEADLANETPAALPEEMEARIDALLAQEGSRS